MTFLSRAFSRKEAAQTESRLFTGFGNIPSPTEDAYHSGNGYIPEGSPMSLAVFYACVTLLADTVASLSVKAYRQNQGTQVLVDTQPKLFVGSPYPGMTWFEWLWMIMESLAVTGNGFGYISNFDTEGRPLAILPIHPDCVRIELPQTYENNFLQDPIYYMNGHRVPGNRVMHIRRYPIAGCALGMSPVQKMANTIGLSLAAERYGLRYFRDSANPSGILSTEQELTPSQQTQTMKSWITAHSGRRLPAVLSNGIKWTPVTLTPEESQFLLTREHQRTEIMMLFRIPPHMLGDISKATSFGRGIEQQSIGFTMWNLRPWLTCFEQALTMFLPRGQFAEFNIDGLLRGDVKTRWEAYRLGRESGVYSVNDIRALENLPPVEDGDGRLQPMNFAPLGYVPPKEDGTPERFEPTQLNNADDGEGED